MPEITIKYEHPHELTDLLAKLSRMYVDEPKTANILHNLINEASEQAASSAHRVHIVTDDDVQSELEKGYRDRIANLVKQNQELRKQVDGSKFKEDDLPYRNIVLRCLEHGFITVFSNVGDDDRALSLPDRDRINLIQIAINKKLSDRDKP